MSFLGSHILSVQQFERQSIERLFTVAERMRPYANREKLTTVLDGAILGSLFFEPSTRTRVSFGSAFNLLGGDVRETVGVETSSLAKGESLYDTARVLSGYSDIIVMRHPQPGSVAEFAAASRVPVINGGDGANEHPSQALLDLFTMHQEMRRQERTVDNIRIAMVGDLKHGRTVHSLSQLVSLYDNISFVFVSPKALAMPEEITEKLMAAGHTVVETEDLAMGIANVDVIYQTRIQEERFISKDEANQYRGRFRINKFAYSQFCQPTTVVMHPLPRDSRAEANELDNDMNDNPNLAIFRQTDNGVLVRMAMFATILGVEKEVDRYSRPISWKNARK
ncbi:aspartate carbamoyltransferase [Permianibacter aggregans]|uniref:Aspartate carbamoyltransferase n=1 Tax=Permianibacter aggregans TaxID=1510150 RepID=A0A4R6UGV1_9GAMM|nr:aspartate carbamoyltransferase [Permianibacter aggregans]QGX39230.1 aspartate carbamoyltransferase [Permianibacter aggregans]TDQ46038.1 aspartate carbamoyltransferase [Permianibacter aggregans]